MKKHEENIRKTFQNIQKYKTYMNIKKTTRKNITISTAQNRKTKEKHVKIYKNI